MTISDDFKWSSHISSITKKANQQLGFVRRNTRKLPQSFREVAYKSLVRPHLEYCSSVWDPHINLDTQKLERIQRQAARYVTGDYKRTSSVTEMMQILQWPSLSTRRTVNRLTMVYKILNGLVAIPSEKFFTYNNTRTRRTHNMILQTYLPRGNIDKFAFAQRSVPEWNKLPGSVVHADTPEKFQEQLSKYVCQHSLKFD